MIIHGMEYFKMLFDHVLRITGVFQAAARIGLRFPLVVTKDILLLYITQLFF
jgi:hypothetical protein